MDPRDLGQYLVERLICIDLIHSEVGHLFICLGAVVFPSSMNCAFTSFPRVSAGELCLNRDLARSLFSRLDLEGYIA